MDQKYYKKRSVTLSISTESRSLFSNMFSISSSVRRLSSFGLQLTNDNEMKIINRMYNIFLIMINLKVPDTNIVD